MGTRTGQGPEARAFEPEQATALDYAEQYEQLDVWGLAHDVAEAMPKRCRTYSPTFGTAGVSAALARMSGWSWGHRYVVRHVLELMGSYTVDGLNDAQDRPLPVCRDTANQIAAQLGMSPGTIDNALSKACAQGILGRTPGAVRVVGAGRKFYPGRPRGPRVIWPGAVLCLLLDEWPEATPAPARARESHHMVRPVSPYGETPEREERFLSVQTLAAGRVEGEGEPVNASEGPRDPCERRGNTAARFTRWPTRRATATG